MNEWIKCEKLPKVGEKILVYDGERIQEAYFLYEEKENQILFNKIYYHEPIPEKWKEPICWMKIPEISKE